MKICRKSHQYSILLRSCPECSKIVRKKFYEKHKDKLLLKKKNWLINNSTQEKNNIKRWKSINKVAELDRIKTWRKDNPTYWQEWKEQNRHKRNAYEAKYRAKKLKATPPWLTKEHLKEIEELYLLAQELAWLNQDGKPFDVDHIIPLQGKEVSGLHVPWNLQLLSHSENCGKNNR